MEFSVLILGTLAPNYTSGPQGTHPRIVHETRL
jgi:hypothetical protein